MRRRRLKNPRVAPGKKPKPTRVPYPKQTPLYNKEERDAARELREQRRAKRAERRVRWFELREGDGKRGS